MFPLQPTENQTPSGPTCILGDISPSEFVNLTLPVYRAMTNHMPRGSDTPSDLTWEAALEMSEEAHVNSVMKYYTTSSFGRLLALAGRRLRLQTEHFQAVLDILGDGSYISSGPIQRGEQVSQRVNYQRVKAIPWYIVSPSRAGRPCGLVVNHEDS